MRETLANVIRHRLESRFLPWHLGLLAILLCTPALRLGWQFDDDFHRAALTRSDLPMVARTPAELFVFVKGDPAANRFAMQMGIMPWWTDEHLRLAFFRPLTGYSHWLDYQLWPDRPAWMHLHSLLWLGAVVVATSYLYRGIQGIGWVAGLAALLFALDDAHGMPAAWLANRSTLICGFFGVLTLIAYDRWRKSGNIAGAILAPVFLAIALLAKEAAIATCAYLFAYAISLDSGTWRRRIMRLVPCIAVVAAWWVMYRLLGYGAVGSSWYINPGTEPLRFLHGVADRLPNLLAWQWIVPSYLEWELSTSTAQVLWGAAMALLLAIGIIIIWLARQDATARFWALGMLLAAVPACAAYPSDRLLLFVGIGGMALVARFTAAVLQRRRRPWTSHIMRPVFFALIGLFVIVHVVMGPWGLIHSASVMQRYEDSLKRAANSLPSDSTAVFQTVLLANTPTFATFAYGSLTRFINGNPYMSRTLVLGTGANPVEIERLDKRTLRIRPRGGYFAARDGAAPGLENRHLLFDQRCGIGAVDRLYRGDESYQIGDRVELFGVAIEVTALTSDGRPAEVVFRFPADVQLPLYRWLKWDHGEFAPFVPPSPGEKILLPVPAWQ